MDTLSDTHLLTSSVRGWILLGGITDDAAISDYDKKKVKIN